LKLVPDMSATVTIDPELERLRNEATLLEAIAKDKPEVLPASQDATGELQAYDPKDADCPALVVGYIPPGKVTELNAALSEIADLPTQRAKIVRLGEINRDFCRWSLRGWALKNTKGDAVPFLAKTEKFRGQDHPVADETMLDILELMKWLGPVARYVQELNNLGEEMRKK